MAFTITMNVREGIAARLFINNVLETVGKKGSIHNFVYSPLYIWTEKKYKNSRQFR